MILKMKAIENDGQVNGWVYWDNFDKIKCVNILRELYDENNVSYNYCNIDHEQYNADAGDDKFIKLVILRKKDVFDRIDEYSIIFNTIAYLCNDEGKTIERLN